MARYFNTSGPCNPAEHFTVPRDDLLERGRRLVEQGRFFTIFAPRQSGKTTYFQLLVERLRKGPYTPIWITFENLKTVSGDVFYRDFGQQLGEELAEYGPTPELTVQGPVDLTAFFQKVRPGKGPLVLFIDEFEGIPDALVGEVMHSFRRLYHRRGSHCLHALILVGVSTMAELVVSSASPFNIADELPIPYFTFDQVADLVGQYEAESGQRFDPAVVDAVYQNTMGQPGLVCGICQHLTEEVATDRSRPVAMADFHRTLKHYLTRKFDKNIFNVVNKAREKREFMLRLLFVDNPIPFTVHDPDIAHLYAHGVVEKVGDDVGIAVPLYAKALVSAFQPLFNGEHEHYVSAHDTFAEYAGEEGLNLRAILGRYREYVRRRGWRAFDTEHLREAAWHYSLDGFLHFFIERLGGEILVEVPSGRGRIDLLILHGGRKYVIETKIFTDRHSFERGKRQLAAYLSSEGVGEGFHVVFSRKHTERDELHAEETIDGRRIITDIIPVASQRPSRSA